MDDTSNFAKSYANLKLKAELLELTSKAINSEYFDLDKLLDFIMNLGIKILNVEAASLLLIDKEEGELYFKVAKGEKANEIKKYTLKLGEGIAGWVAKQSEPLLVPDVNKEPRFKKEIAKEINFPTYTIMAVPLKIRGETIGVIEMINKKGQISFDEEDFDLLNILSNQASIALENAKLFIQYQEKIQDLISLSEVSRMITSSLNPKEVLKTIMQAATNLMRAEASSLMLIDEETGDLVFEVALGEKEEQLKKIRIKRGEGIAGWVAQEGKPLLISDAYSDSRFNPDVDKQTGFKTKSILCVPLKVKDKIIGIAEAINRLDRKSLTFQQEDIELFESFANQAAIAIENAHLYKDLQELFLSTVKSLAAAIDAKNPYTHGHSERVAKYALSVAKELNLDDKEQEIIHLAAILHDVGKIGVSDSTLNKPGKLTNEEYMEIKKHTIIGAQILKPVKLLKDILAGVKSHQERYDGRGYPDGLKGEQIPFVGRILAVCDTYDAMTSDRPYRDKFSDEIALREIENGAGTQFDPKVAKAFISAYEKGEIVKKYKIE